MLGICAVKAGGVHFSRLNHLESKDGCVLALGFEV